MFWASLLHKMFTWQGKLERLGHVLAEKKATLSHLKNSYMVKPEKFYHLHFTVSLHTHSVTFIHETVYRKSMSIFCFLNYL